MDRIQAEIQALESIVLELETTPATKWRRRKYLNELRRGQDALVVSLLKQQEAVAFGQLAKALTGQ